MSGQDAFGILPTGGGKSLCYQIPALLLPGITLVISPLISLMKDQVAALKNAGIDAAFINSSLSYSELSQVLARMARGQYKIVYVAPERLEVPSFLELCRSLEISLAAVDEAHCISQWGQDFRPGYLKITDFLDALPRRPVLAAYTATATKTVREDVIRLLGLRDPVSVLTGFDRPNLNFEVLRPARRRLDALMELVAARRGQSGIIYCATRKSVEEVCGALREAGFPVTRYHAGLSEEERRINQEDFVYDRKPVIAATNAFGMGIDKSNVGYVIHYNMPMSMEAYYQEAGRAGRDGSPADCILLYSGSDLFTARHMLDNPPENDRLTDEQRATVYRQNRQRLDQMAAYCRTTRCLRAVILDYFGEEHAERCGNCGNCRAALVERDITVDAQKILSCVRRISDKLGYPLGKAAVIRVLTGSRERRILNLGLDRLSTYGIMRGRSNDELNVLVSLLEERGYIWVNPDHGGVNLTPAADGILFRGEKLLAAVREEKPAEKKENRAKESRRDRPADRGTMPAAENAGGRELFDALKRLRYELSVKEKVPAYVIFSNAALEQMAARRPQNMEEFLKISGVGNVKAERYGKIFLLEIQRFSEN